MSKKPRKASTSAQGRWEPALMAMPFDEDSWKSNIQVIMKNDIQDECHLKALETVVKIPQRRSFSYLHKNDLLEMVNELGNPKNKRPAKVPQFCEITEIIFGLLSTEQEIPLPLWAKLIKFGLLNIKATDMQRREDVKLKEDKDKAGKGSGKKRGRSKSPGKKGKKTPEPQLPKKDWSTLKKRGEDDDENKFIDDEPDDGPQHYILLSGFKKPQLFVILSEIGIHINGVIKISSESYDALPKPAEEHVEADEAEKDAILQAKVQREIDVKEIGLFWRLLPVILRKASPVSRLQDVGLYECTVMDFMLPADWNNQDNMIGYGTGIFEDIACKIYDSLDWERQYLNYLENMKLIRVPFHGKEEKVVPEERTTPQPATQTSATGKREKGKATLEPTPAVAEEQIVPPITTPAQQEVDMRYYQDLMSCIPMESVSVSLIMHCMLEQVIATEEDKTPPSEKEPPNRTDGIHLALAECIAESLEGLCFSEEDELVLEQDFPQYRQKKVQAVEKNKTPQGPLLLHYGDDVSVRTHHLSEFYGFSPREAELDLLQKMPSARLLDIEAITPEVASERASRLHELHRYATTTGTSGDNSEVVAGTDVNRALQLFLFENMDVSNVCSQGIIQKPPDVSDNVWDYPYTGAAKKSVRKSLPTSNPTTPVDYAEKAATEILEKAISESFDEAYFGRKRNLDSYCYTETFKTPILLQVLEEARQNYPCMDTYRCKRDNSTLVYFHYPMSDDLHSVSDWSSSLHSDVGFRNYLEYVAESIKEWTKVEEEAYKAARIANELEKEKQLQEIHASSESQTTPPQTAKRTRSKSPKKGSRRGSMSRSSSKVGTNEDSQLFSTPFVRAGSLKAEKELQAKLKDEEEKHKRDKEAKHSARKSPEKKEKKTKSAASKSSRPTSPKKGQKSGRKSSSPRSNSSDKDNLLKVALEAEALKVREYSFTGYDVGNNLINIHGKSSFLHPCDGGTIKTENVKYEHGQTFVKTTLYKDGHVFVVHILDPTNAEEDAELEELMNIPKNLQEKPPEGMEKGETEAPEKMSSKSLYASRSNSVDFDSDPKDAKYFSIFGSWCATLCDGMTMSLSSNGPEGVSYFAGKTQRRLMKLLADIPPASSPTPVPQGMDTPRKGKKSPKSGRSPARGKSPRSKSPKTGKKGKEGEKDAEAQKQEELKLQEELERKLAEAEEAQERNKRKRMKRDMQQLYTSCPDGLSVRFQIDPTSSGTFDHEHKLMVRQSYPHKTSGKQPTEKSRSKPAMEEASRVVMADGKVVKIMKDGSTKILFADGTICYNAGSGPLIAEQRPALTPHSPHSGANQPQHAHLSQDEHRVANSAGSKKGSKGGKSSSKTNPDATATDPSIAGTLGAGAAAGLEAEAGARLEAEQERAASWLTTYMSGEVTLTKPNGSVVSQEPILCYTATDPVSGEIMMSREDKVVRIDRPDGSSVCDHSDGTRITRYYREDEEKMQESEEKLQESEETPNLVWFVRVECPGFATVTFNVGDQSCITTFGSGSTLLANTDGTYQLSHWNGGKLDISNDSSVVYTPRPNNDLLIAAITAADGVDTGDSPLRPNPAEPVGSYLMRHNAEVCCEAIDPEGNVFQVKASGEVTVISANSIENATESSHYDVAKRTKIKSADHHPPRLFVINSDGTGTELLRYKDVQDYIGDAHLDPTTAVIKEPMPDDLHVLGITIMRPHFGNSGDAWILQKEESDIIPKNLKTRDLVLFPPKELKTPGPPFGTTLGKGLAVGSAPAPIISEVGPVCPNALELRQLVQNQPISQNLRRHVGAKLLEYGRAVCEEEAQREAARVQDPRSSEEQLRASDLLSLVLEFDDEPTPRSPEIIVQPSGMVQLQESKYASLVSDDQYSPAIKMKYEAAVAPPPLPVVPPPQDKLTQADWDRIRRAIDEEKQGREALKNHNVPPYFNSEQGRAWLLSHAPDMKAAAKQLAPDPRRDGTEARMYEVNGKDERNRRTSSVSPAQDISTEASAPPRGSNIVSDTPSKVRPTNPTPAHASGGGTPTKVRPDNPTPFAAGAQHRNARPSNPTPSHASSGSGHKNEPVVSYISQQYQPSPIPENPTSAQKRESGITTTQSNQTGVYSDDSNHSRFRSLLENEPSDLVLTRSLLYDVTGKPRKEPIRLPGSILSDKPAAIPNEKFLRVEDEVRRKVRTSSIAGGISLGHSKVSERGFKLLPPEVVFGVLREGTTYAMTVLLKNVGIDLCRFRIKQPPPGTGLRVHFEPGPVAAGMETKLEIEIYAIAVGVEGDSGVGTINHQLEITTESEVLHLPISAVVLPVHYYDNRTDSMPTGEKAPGVRICARTNYSRESILRRRKPTVH